MQITIDPKAGFCPGVMNAINIAEKLLRENGELYCLGEIVHNDREVKRLQDLGLKTIDHEQFAQLKNARVLIRSHGEPPETYKTAGRNNIELIDATCGTVLRLQEKIRHHSAKMAGKGGKIVIFGKEEHPEVKGLDGQAGHEAFIVKDPEDVERLDTTGPIRMFSQTTMDTDQYEKLKARVKEMASDKQKKVDFEAYDTICKQVSKRAPYLRNFARSFDVIIFVSGRNSSNGNYLFQVCRSVNPRSYFISSEKEVQRSWFGEDDRVGISGATSTPGWLMEKVARTIKGFD